VIVERVHGVTGGRIGVRHIQGAVTKLSIPGTYVTMLIKIGVEY
jgi:hypothetical protein